MKIDFIPTTENSRNFLDIPKPAYQHVPKWYKDLPIHVDDEKSSGIAKGSSFAPNTTLKACTPFLDALGFGYIWCSPIDLEITKTSSDQYFFKWRTEGEFITSHAKEQHPTLPETFGGSNTVMKWSFDFGIVTPPGYSTFFTHPLNRNELPFRTFSGVVDTDKYHIPVQFPFQLMTDDIPDRIIIEKGTPLCQIIPFKRESWNSGLSKISEKEYKKINFNFMSKIVRSYKSNYWEKKFFS